MCRKVYYFSSMKNEDHYISSIFTLETTRQVGGFHLLRY